MIDFDKMRPSLKAIRDAILQEQDENGDGALWSILALQRGPDYHDNTRAYDVKKNITYKIRAILGFEDLLDISKKCLDNEPLYTYEEVR